VPDTDETPPHPRQLFLAIRHWDAAEVARLLARGADPNWTDRRGDETALGYAARVSTAAVVRVLLAHGATDRGRMPFISAVSWNRTDEDPEPAHIARLLLEHGGNADVNTPDDETGWTPLMEAAAANDVPMVALLIEHGANVNAISLRGETALKAALYNKSEEATRLLIEAGARSTP
jgi:ankyrin repeat protein